LGGSAIKVTTHSSVGQTAAIASIGDLYELARSLGHSNIKMTERYAKLARQYIGRTSDTAMEISTA